MFLLLVLKIGQVAEVLKTQGAQLLFPVALLHAAAFFLGYLISKLSFGESTSRTISIECGMQVIYPSIGTLEFNKLINYLNCFLFGQLHLLP